MAPHGVPLRRQGNNDPGEGEEDAAHHQPPVEVPDLDHVDLGVVREHQHPEDAGYVEEPPPAHGDKEVLQNYT